MIVPNKIVHSDLVIMATIRYMAKKLKNRTIRLAFETVLAKLERSV